MRIAFLWCGLQVGGWPITVPTTVRMTDTFVNNRSTHTHTLDTLDTHTRHTYIYCKGFEGPVQTIPVAEWTCTAAFYPSEHLNAELLDLLMGNKESQKSEQHFLHRFSRWVRLLPHSVSHLNGVLPVVLAPASLCCINRNRLACSTRFCLHN